MKKGNVDYKSVVIVVLAMIMAVVTIMCPIFPATEVKADTGPKPSVVISITGLGDELCYGTLLSEYENSGPYSADISYSWNVAEKGDEVYDIWKAFYDYKDTDGYYFLQWYQRCDDSGTLSWTYYPPQKFKVLLYFPERGTFVVSEIKERYAFDSYFSVKVESSGEDSKPVIVSMTKNYDYAQETMSLGARIIVTIILELALALVMGFRLKRQLLVIMPVNIVTQVVLNMLLNFYNFKNGPSEFVVNYILFEFVVFVIEAVAYCLLLKKASDKMPEVEVEFNSKEKSVIPLTRKNSFIITYAFLANFLSFIGGMIIANVMPGIF